MRKFSLFLFSLFLVPLASAHCPLCTIGAGAAATGAIYLGVSKVAIAVLLGGFAVSMGYWISRVVKKQYIPYQKALLIITSFLITIVPILGIIAQTKGIYIPVGEYGKTFAINISLYTSILGGIIVLIAPSISKKISIMLGKTIPFQGVSLTIILLIIAGGIVHFVF